MTLDERPVLTPARRALSAPHAALAEAIAQEWADQGEHIDPLTMPLTRLAHVAIDAIPDRRSQAAEEMARYGATDLLCHRAPEPDLAALQAERWNPYLDWAAKALDAPLRAVSGVMATDQPQGSLEALRGRAEALDNWRLTGLVSGAPILGSAVLAFALLEAEADGETVFADSRLDERHQQARWGLDAEAAARAAALKRDILAVERLFRIMDAAE